MHYVANVLRDFPKEKIIDKQDDAFKRYHVALVEEKVIVPSKTKAFHDNFIKNEHLSEDAIRLRNILDVPVLNGIWKNWKFTFKDIDKFHKKIETGSLTLKDSATNEDLNILAKFLNECANNPAKLVDGISGNKIFERYYDALIRENVIDSDTTETNTMTINQDFIDGVSLTSGAKELKKIIDQLVKNDSWTKWTFAFDSIDSFNKDKNGGVHRALDDDGTKEEIEDFFNNKLLFAVNMPSEEDLDKFLKDEVGKNPDINLLDTDLMSAYILTEMVNWFKSEKNIWLSTKEGNGILLKKTGKKMDSIRTTGISLEYQQELKRILSFNPSAINEIVDNINFSSYIDSENSKKFQEMYIATPAPEFTTAKVIAALKRISPNGELKFVRDDSFLVTSSSRLQKGGFKKDWIKNALKSAGNPHQLLVVVNDSDDPFKLVGSESDALFSSSESESFKGKKVIVIGKKKTNLKLLLHEDNITFEQLSEETKNYLLSKKISFQGNDFYVRDLIKDGKRNEVFDLESIKELLMTGDEQRKKIPSYFTSKFEKSLYIKRKMTFDFDFEHC